MSEIGKSEQSKFDGNVVPDPFRTMHVKVLKGTQAMMSLSWGREIA